MDWGIATSIALGVIFLWLVYDRWKAPELAIVGVSTVGRHVLYDVDKLSPLRRDLRQLEYESYTVKVMNKRRRFTNRAARNCIPWLLLDTGRCYRLAWVGGDCATTLNLNVGDAAEVDLCAMITKSGNIYAPSCLLPSNRPVFIGNGTEGLTGMIAISSSNSRRARKNIVLYSHERATDNGSFQTLEVNLEEQARAENGVNPHNISDLITRGLLLFSFAGLGLVYTSGWVRWLSWVLVVFSTLLIAMVIIECLLLLCRKIPTRFSVLKKLKLQRSPVLTSLMSKWGVFTGFIYKFAFGATFIAAFVTFYVSWIEKSSQISGLGGEFFMKIGVVWVFVALALLLREAMRK